MKAQGRMHCDDAKDAMRGEHDQVVAWQKTKKIMVEEKPDY